MAKKKVEENKETVDLSDIKEELKDFVSLEIKKRYTEEVSIANKKLLKEKSKKIFWRDIIIILLILLVGYLTYLLYNNNYFDKYFIKDSNIKVETPTGEKEEIPTREEIKNEEIESKKLIEKYSYLLNKINISENSKYIKEYYNGNLTNELKNYLVFNNIDLKKLSLEDDTYVIDDDYFREMYEELFDDEYKSATFVYNNVKIKYYQKLNSYITDEIVKKDESNIKREIISVKEDNGNIYIYTIEGLLKDNKLYNIISNDEIKFDNKNDDLSKYKNKLNGLVYTFKDDKLININNE